ncbi:VRR-NUC domain-containing protein [bacterium]|nr:VRR-NUC domain-containing protein [bacterium]
MKVNEIANKVSKEFPFVFSNDNGTAVVGGKKCTVLIDAKIYVKTGKECYWMTIKKGTRLTIGGSTITYGLFPGSADRVGWDETVITADMVGQTIAMFTSIEIKTENDKLSDKQRRWNRAVRRSGGIAEVWHAIGDVIERLKGGEIE